MRFGACTWIMGDEPLPVKAQRMAAIGLDGVELFGDLSLNPREIRKILADHNLAVLSLPPENVDLSRSM
jgi:D-psicose/D-tagatose/L-ribulose 3-epimerase